MSPNHESVLPLQAISGASTPTCPCSVSSESADLALSCTVHLTLHLTPSGLVCSLGIARVRFAGTGTQGKPNRVTEAHQMCTQSCYPRHLVNGISSLSAKQKEKKKTNSLIAVMHDAETLSCGHWPYPRHGCSIRFSGRWEWTPDGREARRSVDRRTPATHRRATWFACCRSVWFSCLRGVELADRKSVV